MKNYKIELLPKTSEDGKTYWTARFPTLPGCVVGGGDTIEEAIAEANENLAVYLEYLAEEGLPEPTEKQVYNGKIALRVAKSLHEEIAERALEEQISINLFLNNAISYYLGATH